MNKNIIKEINNYIDNIPDDEFINMMKESENDLWTIEIPNNVLTKEFRAIKLKNNYNIIYKNINIHDSSKNNVTIKNIHIDKIIEMNDKFYTYDIIKRNGVA